MAEGVVVSGAGQADGEGRALAGDALDGHPAPVVLGDVLYDGEAEARTAGRLGARLVHPIEPLEDARELPLGDADARVGDADDDLIPLRTARHLDPPAGRRVLYGVVHEVGEHGGQLGLVAVAGVAGGLAKTFPLAGYEIGRG